MRGINAGVSLLCACAALCLLAACHAENGQTESSAGAQMQESSAADASTWEEISSKPPETPSESSVTEEETMLTITISAGDQTFSATLYENPSAKALLELLPLTLRMSELNGNEKYFYLEETLPTDASRPSGIRAGDLMLYGNNCLVLFYESFSTSYTYTPLGHIDDPNGLASALGSGDVQVTFRKG